MTCKHYFTCMHYCALTESCDYLLNTGSLRPHKPENCPGYPVLMPRRIKSIKLPGSYNFGNNIYIGGRSNAQL